MSKNHLITVWLIILALFIISDLYSADVSGNISSNTTWDLAGSPYNVVGTVTVYSGATLSIESGVTVNFPNDGYQIQVGYTTSSTGTLIADNVTFTCPDVNDTRVVILENSDATISNCTFDNVYLQIERTNPSVTNSSFDNVEFPIYFNGGSEATLSSLTFESNVTYSGIRIGNYINFDMTLQNYGFPYYIHNQTLEIRSGATATIASGNTFNFLNDGYQIQVGYTTSSTGTLIADNVTFTCPDVNDTRIRILENSGATISNCIFDHTRLQLDNVSPTITNNRFKKCSIAVLLQNGATPTFYNNDLFNNILAVQNESTTLANCENNYWGHMSGPQHTSNPSGEGEQIEGNVDPIPFSSSPYTGTVTPIVLKTSVNYGIVTVNVPVDSIIKITSEGDIDVLVTRIESDNEAFFVTSPTRFWTEYGDTNNVIVRFVATEDIEYSATLTIHTNNPDNPEIYVALTGMGTGASNIENQLPKIPTDYFLGQNYPNPFNPSTTIRFGLVQPQTVRIEVYNVNGQKILTILNQFLQAGYHSVLLNNTSLPSGIYYYRIHAGEYEDVKKMIIVR